MPMVMPASQRKRICVPAPNRKRWTRKECEFLVKNELLIERYELIDGEIISLMGQNRPHLTTVMRFTAWLIHLFGEDYVQCQGPIDVANEDNTYNEPEPDIAALAKPLAAYTERNPVPEELLLVVEVSDSTLAFDLRTKSLQYARAGIQDYWVADVPRRQIIVHRNPSPSGYQEVISYTADETLSPLARPEVSVQVSELFPPLPDA